MGEEGMTTAFDSFDESALGAFIESPLAVRGGGGRALLWLKPGDILNVSNPPTYRERTLKLKEIYLAAGSVMDDDLSWSGELAEYSLIIVLLPIRDPEWMAVVRAGGWSGRIHLCAEWSALGSLFFRPAATYMTSLESLTGMRVVYSSRDTDANAGVNLSHPLNVGADPVYHNATSVITGGAGVVRLVTSETENWVAASFQNGVDWVFAGDTNHITSYGTGGSRLAELNSRWLLNLLDVSLG